ncbi:MAG: hypothetical protein AMS27_06230 [Bacteroides sp. SM23_62_1]|nr:MAG: hypothetical protein AMS27_06230 [Bacteroides sp. SM23_62_1]
MKTEAEFKHFYETQLMSELKEIEIKRLNAATRIRTLLIFELIILIVILVYVFWFRTEDPSSMPGPDLINVFWIMGSLVILGFIFVLASAGFSRSFRKMYKKNIIGKLVGRVSKDLAYFRDDKVEFNEFKASRLYNMDIASYKGRDLVTGKLSDISYRFSWLQVYGRTMPDQKMKSGTFRIFRGVFFVADFQKQFITQATVYPNIGRNYRFDVIMKFLQDTIMGRRIEMNDPEFDKEFAVYSEDEENIKKLLSPGLRQWIVDFKARTKSMLSLSFSGSKMFIAVNLRKNLFEPAIFRKVTDYDTVYENFQYIMLFGNLLEDMGKKA